MPSGFQVTCVNKDRNGTIIRLGGPGWSLGHHEAIQKISSNQLRLHIYIGYMCFDIDVRGDGGDAYLALEPEGTVLDSVEGFLAVRVTFRGILHQSDFIPVRDFCF